TCSMAENNDEHQEVSAETSEQPDRGAVFAHWEGKEHDEYSRGVWWYVIAGLVVLAILIFAYFNNNPLLAAIVVLSIFTFSISEYRGADTRAVEITEDGILVGNDFHSYDTIKNFFIIYQPPQVKMLYFDPKRIYRPLTGISLEDQDPNEIREILLQYLPEDIEREEEPTSDFWGRLLKF
ncbi:MAG: hypothetical protein AAB490_01875, partial [Patescibacteria group bacterium]